MKWWLYRLLHPLAKEPQTQAISLPTVYLPLDVIKATAQLISNFGTPQEPHEGVAYWAGIPTEQAWVITTVLVPRAFTTPGSFNTSAVANAQVITKVNEFHLHLLAQIHGHPRDWVDHSTGDDRGAFMPYPGFYSVVVPFYGRQGLLPLSTCGIHRYESGCFRRLAMEEIERQFVTVPATLDLRR